MAKNQMKYNQKEGECRWSSSLIGKAVDCDFNIEVIKNLGNGIKLVKLKKGTDLYHKTFLARGIPWWKDQWPQNTELGGIFFTTPNHTRNISGMYSLTYRTKSDINMVYIQNITKIFNSNVGYDFITKVYQRVLEEFDERGIKISGYIGCNECEIFINNEDIKNCVYKEPINIEDQSKYI